MTIRRENSVSGSDGSGFGTGYATGMRDKPSIPLPARLGLLGLLVLLSMWLLAVPSAASGLPASITISPETAEPGDLVQVAGLDFPAGETIQLQLTTTAGAVHLGTASTADGGYFRQAVTLPTDVAPGFWELRATAPDGSVGVLIFEAGEAAPALVAGAATAEADTAARGGLSGTDMMVMLVAVLLVAGVGGAFAYAWFVTHRDSREPGMGAGDDPIWGGSLGDDPIWMNASGDS